MARLFSISNSDRRRIVVGGVVALVALLASRALLTRLFHDETIQSLVVKAISPATRLVLIGSSHVETDVDPRLLTTPSVNLAVGYLDYVNMERVWQVHADSLIGARLVVVEWSLGALLLDTRRYASSSAPEMADIGLEEPCTWTSLTDVDDCVRRFLSPFYRHRVTPKVLADRAVAPVTALVPGHLPSDLVYAPDRDDPIARSKFEFIRGHTSESLQARNLDALERLLRDLAGRGIPARLLAYPMSPRYHELLPDDWRRLLDDAHAELGRRLGAAMPPLTDLSRMPAMTPDHFRDVDHLNSRGATRFTGDLDALTRSWLGAP